MISVVIATQDDELTLGQTLASLVPAAVDGLVREVIVADSGSADGTLAIADDAGARIVRCEGAAEARLAAGCKAARADWLLILEASASAPHGWEGAAGRHMERHPGKPACWGRSGLVPFVTPAKALLVPSRLFEQQSGSAGWLRRIGRKAVELKIKR
ncbi:MAG TPA: glycosyltransferase [Caulobacteraceae bacterium]|jgi:glycosyltransferase involved in cell wall biosynthesis